MKLKNQHTLAGCGIGIASLLSIQADEGSMTTFYIVAGVFLIIIVIALISVFSTKKEK